MDEVLEVGAADATDARLEEGEVEEEEEEG